MASLTTFARLWFVLASSYLIVKLVFNLVALNRIDLRLVAFEELIFVPLGQAIVYWAITARHTRPPQA